MSDQDDLSGRVGRIALAQAQVDEWLVQVLIELLKPLPESRVQILVGANSLDQKASLIRKVANDLGLSLETPLASGAIPHEILKRAVTLNNARDQAVHSYYAQVEQDAAKRFRSRRPEVGAVSLVELSKLGDDLLQCVGELRELADTLAQSAEDQLGAGSRWGEVVRGVHEVIVAGHLYEQNLLDAVIREIEAGRPVRLGLSGTKRRVVGVDEDVSPEEFLAEISTSNWLATISAPDGKVIQFGDSGWRDVTVLARAEDPAVEYAVIRRVGDSVQLSVEGGEMATAVWPQSRDRLAERAFGPAVDPGLMVSDWVRRLDGFAPSRDA